jgi:hypothetical protein
VICQNIQHPVTEQMVDALARAIAADAKAGFITEYAALRPHGHRCVSTKSCPGNLMWARMGLLKTKIAARLSALSSGGSGGGGVPLPDPNVPDLDLDLLRKATDMILVKQADTDRIWLLTGTSRRHVADVAAFQALQAAGVPFDEDAEVSSQLLQWFPQAGGTLAEIRSVFPAP